MVDKFNVMWLVFCLLFFSDKRADEKSAMKTSHKIITMSMIVLACLCTVSRGDVFHTGLTDSCFGCHAKGGDNYTLIKSDPSSTCLRCHQAPEDTVNASGFYIATDTLKLADGMAPSQLTPGGDFGYLKKTYSWRVKGRSEVSSGERHGHNIIAADYGYTADLQYDVAPGGTYPSRSLSCISCHNPHATPAAVTPTGNTGTYRLLGNGGYVPRSISGAVAAFSAPAPIAVSPTLYNRKEDKTDTRVAYGEGMSEWCRNCHTAISGHPAGSNVKMNAAIVSNYNSYVKTGSITGDKSSAYSSLTPFEEGTDDVSTLAIHAGSNGEYKEGPEYGANVMCLTCHRAHASGFDNSMRWDTSVTLIVSKGAYPGTDNQPNSAHGRTSAELRQAYYGRPASFFADSQRSYCNKCHTRD